MNWYKKASTAQELKAIGVEIRDGKAILYRGTDIPNLTIKDLRYGDFLSSHKSGHDWTGNLAADTYGKYVERYEIPIEDVEISSTGELQYRGRSKSLSGKKYPLEIYKAFNDVYGSNYTAEEIDKMDDPEVRNTASMGLAGGREEFDLLTRNRRK